MSLPIQEEPESTIGRRPPRHAGEQEQREEGQPPLGRSGAAVRREEGDESEFAGEIRERERDEPEPDEPEPIVGPDETA